MGSGVLQIPQVYMGNTIGWKCVRRGIFRCLFHETDEVQIVVGEIDIIAVFFRQADAGFAVNRGGDIFISGGRPSYPLTIGRDPKWWVELAAKKTVVEAFFQGGEMVGDAGLHVPAQYIPSVTCQWVPGLGMGSKDEQGLICLPEIRVLLFRAELLHGEQLGASIEQGVVGEMPEGEDAGNAGGKCGDKDHPSEGSLRFRAATLSLPDPGEPEESDEHPDLVDAHEPACDVEYARHEVHQEQQQKNEQQAHGIGNATLLHKSNPSRHTALRRKSSQSIPRHRSLASL